MGDFVITVAWGLLGSATVAFLAIMLIGRWTGDIPTHKPKPIKVAIEELSAHKLQHQSWVEGQRLAMEWWEQQCSCPVPTPLESSLTELRALDAAERAKQQAFEQDVEDWRKEQYHHFRTGSALWLEEQRRVHERMH